MNKHYRFGSLPYLSKIKILSGFILVFLLLQVSDVRAFFYTNSGAYTRISVASDGTEGNGTMFGNAFWPDMSADGRFVVFASDASNLVPSDSNGDLDIFLHDNLTGETTLASISSDETQGNWASFHSSISSDGRYISFSTVSTNLNPIDTEINSDIYVHDTLTGETTLVSVTSGDEKVTPGGTRISSISANGRYVVFDTTYKLASNDLDILGSDIYIRDRQLGTTELISVSTPENYYPDVSADGRFVVFESWTSHPNIYLYDRQTNVTHLISAAPDGSPATNGNPATLRSLTPQISADGRYITYVSTAANIVIDENEDPDHPDDDVFLFDIATGQNTLISTTDVGRTGGYPSISTNGNYVAYLGGGTQKGNIHIYNTITGDTIANPYIAYGAGTLYETKVSNDGQKVAFGSTGNVWVPEDTNGVFDLFLFKLGNTHPVANAGEDHTVLADTLYTFDGSGSFDFENDPLTYLWIEDEINPQTGILQNSNTQNPSFTPTIGGLYQFKLIVNDGMNSSEDYSTTLNTVFITVPNSAPTANAGEDQTTIVNTNVSLNGSSSYDPEGQMLTYSWSESINNPQTGILQNANSGNPSFMPTIAGSYVFSLTVNDGELYSSPDAVVVIVQTHSEAIEDIIDLVETFNLQQGINNSLDAKLDAAQDALDDINGSNNQAAINSLESFINAVEAQRGNKITNEQADQLIAAAQAIINSLL